MVDGESVVEVMSPEVSIGETGVVEVDVGLGDQVEGVWLALLTHVAASHLVALVVQFLVHLH